MSPLSATRKLAAVVVADIVGYSRMMEKDEAGTLERVRALVVDVVEPTTTMYRGRVVKGTGDGWLAEFASVTDAVESSLEIQEQLAAGQRDTPQAGRLALRIGVSLGEVIFEGDDIFGTGVNLAARLESIAKPGGICISDWVHEQIRALPDLRVEDMGIQSLKNLETPIHSYMAYRRSGDAADGSPRSPATPGPPIHGGASIAVLPFANLSGDPAQEYLVDGIVDDILTFLSRFKSLVVIARQSSFAYKGRSIDVREVGRDLGVRYVLEGSVQRSDDRVRITSQLIDATTGSHVWADRFDGVFSDIFDMQDRITEQVVAILEPQIRRAEIERARRARPEDLDAYDLYLRALPHVYAMRPADNTRGLELLAESMRLDPTYVPAKAFAAWCYEQRVTRAWPTLEPSDAENAISLARATIDADSGDANVISIAGFVLVMVGRQFEAGLAALRDSVELNPNNAFVLMNAGWAEVFAGSLDRSQVLLERARALSPRDPAAFYVLTGLAMTHLLDGHWEQAAALAVESAALYADWDATFFVLAMALADGGRSEEAQRALDRLLELMPTASVSHYRRVLPVRTPERWARFEAAMTKARLPA